MRASLPQTCLQARSSAAAADDDAYSSSEESVTGVEIPEVAPAQSADTRGPSTITTGEPSSGSCGQNSSAQTPSAANSSSPSAEETVLAAIRRDLSGRPIWCEELLCRICREQFHAAPPGKQVDNANATAEVLQDAKQRAQERLLEYGT